MNRTKQFNSSTLSISSTDSDTKIKFQEEKTTARVEKPKKYLSYAYIKRNMPDKLKKTMIEDLDGILKSYHNPQVPYQYFFDVYSFCRSKQSRNIIHSNHLELTSILDKSNKKIGLYSERRYKYINTLHEVIRIFKYQNSLVLAVTLFDKLNQMISKKSKDNSISQQDIDINTYASFFMSGKYCEIYPFSWSDSAEILSTNISLEKITQRQMDLFCQMKWNIVIPSEFDYFQMFSLFGTLTVKDVCLCKYLLQVGLSYFELIKQKSLVKAASVIAIMTKQSDKALYFELNNIVGALTEIKPDDLQRVTKIYSKIYQKELKKPGAIARVFSNQQFQQVSKKKIKLFYL